MGWFWDGSFPKKNWQTNIHQQKYYSWVVHQAHPEFTKYQQAGGAPRLGGVARWFTKVPSVQKNHGFHWVDGVLSS